MTQRGTRGEPPITINPFDCLLITKLQVEEEPGTGGGGRTARDPFPPLQLIFSQFKYLHTKVHNPHSEGDDDVPPLQFSLSFSISTTLPLLAKESSECAGVSIGLLFSSASLSGGCQGSRKLLFLSPEIHQAKGFPSTRNAEGTTGFLGDNSVTLYSRLGFFLFRRSTNWRGDSSSKSICPPQNENIWPVSSTSVQPR